MITEAKYLNENKNFKVELVKELPCCGKIVIAYSHELNIYYIVKYNDGFHSLKLTRLSCMEDDTELAMDEDELFNDTSFTIYLLDNLNDFSELPLSKE